MNREFDHSVDSDLISGCLVHLPGIPSNLPARQRTLQIRRHLSMLMGVWLDGRISIRNKYFVCALYVNNDHLIGSFQLVCARNFFDAMVQARRMERAIGDVVGDPTFVEVAGFCNNVQCPCGNGLHCVVWRS